MPLVHVKKSIVINKGIAEVKNTLINLHTMTLWSPWYILEPNANTSFSDVKNEIGSWQEWDGEIIGAGRIEITAISDEKIEMDLSFFKPFKSQAKTCFLLNETNEGVEVSWVMDSSLPWFMFFFKKMMSAMIGMDYEKGLRMLKDYVETGEILSKISIDEETFLDDMNYVGIKNETSMDDIGDKMKNDFNKLIDFAQENSLINEKTEYFSIYNKFDIVKDNISYISAISIDDETIQIPQDFIKSKIKKSKAIKVIHQGKYEHLGNAWGLAMMYPRAKGIKIIKKPVGYEFYYNSPKDTDDKDLLASVMVGIK